MHELLHLQAIWSKPYLRVVQSEQQLDCMLLRESTDYNRKEWQARLHMQINPASHIEAMANTQYF